MNVEDYANHIAQKCRVSVAIAVLKSKPEEVTLEEYIKLLRDKLQPVNMDVDDLDVTVCSDDFNCDDVIADDNNWCKADNIDIVREQSSPSLLKNIENYSMVHTITNTSAIENGDAQNRSIVETLDSLKRIDNVSIKPKHTDSQIINNNIEIADVNSCNDSQKTHFNSQNLEFSLDKNYLEITKEADNIDVTLTPFDGEFGGRTQKSIFNSLDSNTTFCESQILELSRSVERRDEIPNTGTTFCTQTESIKHVDSQATQTYDVDLLLINLTHVKQTRDGSRFEISEKVRSVSKTNTKHNKDAESSILSQNERIHSHGEHLNVIIEGNKEFTSNTNVNVEESHRDDKHGGNGEKYKDVECKDIENIIPDIDDIEEDREILIPFKVVEELNRVKRYLSEKDKKLSQDGLSTDSGYRSDQSRLVIGANSNENWLNQSANYLFNYLLESQITTQTNTIVHDISNVMGELIDRLHVEENYPPFLDEVLEKIREMLDEVWDGGSGGDIVMTLTNRTIQKLLLLNQSLHIASYTIEKILYYLEQVYKNIVTTDDLYEVKCVHHIESLCYIFHILEILLRRYLKLRDLGSQSSQISQEKSQPTRSSITDLWKRKWCSDSKKAEPEMGIVEKECVTVKCGEILKKIIVDSMESYSLISFSALQCFNLLQS